MPKLVLAPSAKLDMWFVAFEARMPTSMIPKECWPSKFVECPEVPEAIKSRLSTYSTYAEIRSAILKSYGPADPVNYFRLKLYSEKGGSGEEVRDQLLEIMNLHNRAADMVVPSRESLNQQD